MRIIFVFALFYFALTPLSSQCIKGDCYSGTGTFVFNSGAVYTGQFIRGKMEGKGRCEFTNGNIYYGEWKNQFIEGIGTMKFKNGDVYFGQFSRGKMNGSGSMQYSNGERFEGQWKNNQRHGEGKLYVNGKLMLDGIWNEDRHEDEGSEDNYQEVSKMIAHSETFRNCNKTFCASGEGTFTYRDGSIYSGEFKNGFPEGEGYCQYANGDIYKGGWKSHGPHGDGIMYFKSGRVYAANWNYGKPTKELRKEEELKQFSKREEEENVIRSAKVNIYAVVIGVSNYNHMPRLKYTDDDAYKVYAFMKSPEGGAIPDEHIQVLVDESATKKSILKAMEETFWKADENDVILLYFSGHGLDGAFLPFDFDGYNNLLQHKEIMNIFNRSKAKHKVCFADACHSGSLVNTKSPSHISMRNFFRGFETARGGTAIMTSSKSEEVSLEFSGLRQGVFSHYLIKGLKGEADYNNDRIVTISELFSYVSGGVKNYTFNSQTPTLSGDFDLNMPVAHIRRGKPGT